jgi:cell division septation protein DedD
MERAMRNLEQIQEDENGSVVRRVGLYALATAAAAGLVLAVGAVVDGRSAVDAPAEDPLARLDREAGLAPDPEERVQAMSVDRESLTFPSVLVDDVRRPEVEATVAAARAEAAALAAAERAASEAGDGRPAPAVRTPAALVPPTLPAAIAVGGGLRGSALAAGDPLLARATGTEGSPAAPETTTVPERAAPVAEPASRGRDEPSAPPAPPGRDGRYTVQVISYETRAEAAAFAAALRARGYGAFVSSAEVPGRGTMYRVRIGPFETLRSAEAFRREFENRERMATLVVRRPDDARSAAE